MPRSVTRRGRWTLRSVLALCVAGCAAPAPPSNDNDNAAGSGDDPVPGTELPVEDCVAVLNAVIADGGEQAWTLSIGGPGGPGELQALQLLGRGDVLRQAVVEVAGEQDDAGFFEELVFDFEIVLEATRLVVTAGGLAADASTTRIFLDGDPSAGRCLATDGGARLADVPLAYTITIGADTRLQDDATDGALAADE